MYNIAIKRNLNVSITILNNENNINDEVIISMLCAQRVLAVCTQDPEEVGHGAHLYYSHMTLVCASLIVIISLLVIHIYMAHH